MREPDIHSLLPAAMAPLRNDALHGVRIGIVVREWSPQFGGNISLGILAGHLAASGAEITFLLTESDVEPSARHDGMRYVAVSQGRGSLSALVRESLRQDMLIIVGEKPRLAFLALQWLRPVVFLRLDTILTCPAGTRYLPRSSAVCGRNVGLSCLAVHDSEGCLGGLSRTRQLARIAARVSDMLLLRGFRNFAANSHACASRHRRPARVFHPPCPKPVSLVREYGSADLIFVGRLAESKGGVDTIDILARATRAGTLHVVGDGPARPAMEAAAAKAGIQQRVIFHGWMGAEQRDALILRCGVTIMCSKWDEAFGRIGPESFALGTPVVAYDVGGVSEWCKTPAGRLVACGDTADAAMAVDRFLSDREIWNEASNAARRFAAAFTDDAYAAQWIAYIKELLGARREAASR
ncbi:glycosyltransferase [Iodidimonas sp. SYSU 1G8]|uniref:glycosyltransferase family 4 protein n=1 Tax=Iodidimonas sp. SYSU 1G8 TaxID=3133967 RepID=UPI0031FF1FC4